MYSVYCNDDCLYSSFKKEDTAIKAALDFIETSKSEYIATGNDNGNLWWLIRFTDDLGFTFYEVISVVNNPKNLKKVLDKIKKV